VANTDSNNVSVIDTVTNTVMATVAVGTSPVAFGQFIGPAVAAPTTPATIPTMSEWGMILLSSLLALGTILILRRQRQ
jgi:YVTN family beta-propeller protein